VALGVIITDSFGRAWRRGQCDVAIGCAGLTALDDWRGHADARGHELKATVIAIADELAAAADLARSKDGMQPAVLVSGAGRHVTEEDGPGVLPLLRSEAEDLFR
jgi:coenzyme F420-0:L-glutamate ligase/coenzyme F420-1:gamma-L-glutamate ligase